jgi:Mn-dependent DtxR family transcriptional regulator
VAGTGVEEGDTYKIVREDVLRILGERKRKLALSSVRSEIEVSSSLIERAVSNLEKEGLIKAENGFIELTRKGKDEAKDIVRKHLVLESYFKEKDREGRSHQAAHILEHYISNQVINNIRKLSSLKESGVPLTSLELHKEGLITDLLLSDQGLFERMVSMGIFLGESLTVTNQTPNGIIVKVGNKKYALDKEIARKIKVATYEKA